MEAKIAAKVKNKTKQNKTQPKTKPQKTNLEAHGLEWGYQLPVYRDYLPD